MLKLYRFTENKKEYWETWDNDDGSHTENTQGQILHCATLSTKPTGHSPPPSITPENKQLMSNALAWMRAKPRWYMDVPSWRLRSHQEII